MKKFIYLFLTLCLIFMSQYTVAQVPSYVPTDGLVGYWPFDGNANDASGNGRNGVVNGAVLTTNRFNNEDSAFYFDGTNDNIKTAPLPSALNEAVSISIWIKSDNNTGEWNGIITTQPDPSEGFLLQENISDRYQWSVSTGTNYDWIYSNSFISYEWDHWVCILDENNLMTIYVNGLLDAGQAIQNNNLSSTADLCIGSRYGNEWFKGKLDDIGIWNRSLTEQEIIDLYNSQVLSTNSATYESNLNIYPNPATDHINIDFGNLDNVEGWNIKIINILGQEVLSQPMNTDKINVSELSKGIYIIKISDAMSQIDRKFIKN